MNPQQSMEWRGSPTELARNDADGWYAAPGIVVWRIGGVDGSTFWGHVTTAQLEAAFEVVRHYAGVGAIEVVSDLAAMTSFDDAVYPRLSELVTELVSSLASRVRRHVVILPDGMIRATAAGFLHLHAEHAWHLAPDLGTAIGEPDAARIARLVAQVRATDVVTALRARLDDGLPAAARALGLTPRSLQRSLRSAGTSFRTLVDEARIAEACRMLDQTDLKVEAIGREVGFESLSGFVRAFRRACGCSPHQRRRRGYA